MDGGLFYLFVHTLHSFILKYLARHKSRRFFLHITHTRLGQVSRKIGVLSKTGTNSPLSANLETRIHLLDCFRAGCGGRLGVSHLRNYNKMSLTCGSYRLIPRLWHTRNGLIDAVKENNFSKNRLPYTEVHPLLPFLSWEITEGDFARPSIQST